MAFEIGKTSSGAKYVVGNNGNTVYLSQAGIKIKNELIAGANKYVVYVLNVTDVIYSGPLDSLLYNGGSISSDPKVAIDFLVSEGWVNFKPGSTGGGAEVDPVFKASPAGSITQADIDLWNSNGGGTFDPSAYDLAAFKNQSIDPFVQESDLLNKADLAGGKVPASQLPSYVDDVIEGANLAAFPIPGETGKIYLALNNNKIYRWSGSTYIDMTPTEADTLQSVTTRNPVTTNTITIAGLYATALPTLDSSYAKNIVAKLDGRFGWQDIITHYNTARLSYYSGRYSNMLTANGLLNMFIGGSNAVKDLTTITGQENTLLTYSDNFDLTSGSNNLGIGYQSGSFLTTGSNNVFLGRRTGKNITTGSNNIIIGTNGNSGTDITYASNLTNYIQLLAGTPATITPANNKLNIGNWIFGDNGNIGIGVAPTNKLDVNGNITVRTLPSAIGDGTYIRNVVTKVDGTFGYENRLSPTLYPKVDIIDYVTTDPTNYIIRVRVSNINSFNYGVGVPFNVACSGNPQNAVGVSATINLAANLCYTPNPAGGFIGGFADFTILIPKASNTSPVWNSPSAPISVTWTGTDNADGGVNSPYTPRRIANDTRVIGQVLPKYNEAGQVKVNYTGLSITGFTNNTSKQFNIAGATPTIVASPTTKYPNSTPNSYIGFFDSARNGGTTTFAGRLIENPIQGQPHTFRIQGTYANKANNNVGALDIIIRNPVSGNTFTRSITLPDGRTTGGFDELILVIADNVSIPSPNGYILEAQTSFTDTNLTINITSMTRFSDAIEPTYY